MARLEAVCRLEAESGESPPCLHRSAVCTCRRSESRSYTAPWSRHWSQHWPTWPSITLMLSAAPQLCHRCTSIFTIFESYTLDFRLVFFPMKWLSFHLKLGFIEPSPNGGFVQQRSLEIESSRHLLPLPILCILIDIDVEIGELYSSVEGESGVPVIGDKTWRSYSQDFYIDIRCISNHEKIFEMLSQHKLMSHVREACMK